MATFTFESKQWRKSVSDAMASNGISYRKLSKKTGLNVSMLHRIIHGKTDPRIYDLLVISNVLAICPIEFFDEKEFQKKLF